MVEGAAAASTFGLSETIRVELTEITDAAAPSTTLRVVPLPRFTGEDVRGAIPLDPGPAIRDTL